MLMIIILNEKAQFTVILNYCYNSKKYASYYILENNQLRRKQPGSHGNWEPGGMAD